MKLEINTDTLLNSTLTPDQLILLLLIHKKDFKAAERLVLKMYGFSYGTVNEIYELLEADGWLKINGKKLPADCLLRQKFLELLNDKTDMDIVSWVDEYRNLFKGKKPGAVGDRELSIRHLTWLLTEYPEYTKEDIMKAAKYYISTCAKDNYMYLVRSHYFISKELPAGGTTHQILTYLEEVKDDSFTETKDFTTSI